MTSTLRKHKVNVVSLSSNAADQPQTAPPSRPKLTSQQKWNKFSDMQLNGHTAEEAFKTLRWN